ncbi:E3 ubiquitin-protein ligase RNF123 [Sparus aurata]|uniref:E3 ubiquitin-protein ligase RNF123 n=1 Tax=Sparus aurata TaxID=8175 RepID=UPI0011C18CFC|nr:E3 ubiquitin-protein ligase RNF123 [Sparus aurata]
MSSKGGSTALTRRNYRLASDTDKPRATGIVNEKLLSDFLHHVFPSTKQGPALASLRKPLGFQDLSAHLERLLSEGDSEDSRDQPVEGRLGPQPVVLDHTSGFEGLLFVDDDLLGVIGHSNFSSIRATTCVYKGKWAYEVLISSQGLMQIGWCTLNCRFNQEEGVGDTPDSYAYDGNRVRKWNVTTTNYGKSWAAGDIVSCLIDLDEGTITFCLNGQSLGTAFTNIKMGPGVAYFPAISLSFKESVAFNFGSRPLRYPVDGYLPLQNPPTADLIKAHKLLGYMKNVLGTSIDTQEEKLVDRDVAVWRLHGDATVLITLAHIFNHFAPLMCKVYLVEDVLMNFLLGILEGGGSVDEHPLIQQLLDLFWLLMEDYEVNECLKQLMMSLLRAYRFSPIIPDLGFQIHYLRLTTAILHHEKSRKYLLNNVLFDVLRSVVFFYIKTPLRVKEAGLEELILTTWWPTHFDKEGKDEREPADESADERLRRRAYERGCQRLKKRIEVVEELQVQILKLLLNNKDKSTGEASRYIFLNKFRKFLQENASNRGHPTALCPPEYMVCFLHRLITAVRASWDDSNRKSPGSVSSEEAYVPPQLFYNGKVDYFDLQRLGGLLSHLKKTLKDDLASKANIIIDPAEIQATSMDDLDEPCPSLLLQRHMAELLSLDKDMAASFLNSVLNQLNWAFSEFIGMIQEIQQAAERPERNFVDTRQLKVCATCFDLSVSLLRVLEMTVTLVPEIFLDWSRPSAELLLRRLAQLLNQVLNRVTAEKNLFDRVVNLRLPGLESVDHYPILVAVTGILVRILVDGDRQGVSRAASVLLSDPCFQLHSIQHLLGEGGDSSSTAAAVASSIRPVVGSLGSTVAPPIPSAAGNTASSERKHFSLHAYTDYISEEEKQKVELMLAFLTEESKQAAASTAPTSEEDLCPICYAHSISAVFKPCSHKSCKACINQHLMNNKDCFFCKATITGVEDYSKPASS